MDYLAQNIAVNLNRTRLSKGMSLDIVSEQTGVSKSMLHQIEKGEANPSISVLGKIASGMRIGINELLSTPPVESSLIKISKLIPTKEVVGQYEIRTCLPYEDNRMVEIYRIDIEPGGVYTSGGHGENTREYISVIEGSIRIEGDNINQDISTDDLFMFNCEHSHKYINTNSKKSNCLCFFMF